MKNIIKTILILWTIKLQILGATVTFDWTSNTTGDTSIGEPYTTTATQTVLGEELNVVVDTGGLLIKDENDYYYNDMTNINGLSLHADGNTSSNSYTLSVTGGKIFDLKGFNILDQSASGGTLSLTTSKGTVTQAYGTTGEVKTFSDSKLQGVASVVITKDGGGTLLLSFDDIILDNIMVPNDSTNTLTAGDGVDESSAINVFTSSTTSASAVEVFDFALTDVGSGDGVATTITSLDIHVSGIDNNKLTYVLDNASSGANQGTDISSAITGSYNSGTVTFDLSSNNIVVSDASTETYVIKTYFNDTSAISDNNAITISIDADTDVTANASGSTFGSTSAITNSGNLVMKLSQPSISSSTYNATTGDLVVTGVNFASFSGASNDIDASNFTFTGEGGSTYTLTDTSDVEISSSTSFTLTLSTTDKNGVNLILNKNGSSSTSSTTYNLAAAEDWMPQYPGSDVDTTNSISVSNVPTPTITSATYNGSTSVLVVTGTNFVKYAGLTNDIDISKITITGDSAATYTLTSASDVEITSSTSFSITLAGTDKTNVNLLLNKDGTSAYDSTTYNLALADDWLRGTDATIDITDASNGITVSSATDTIPPSAPSTPDLDASSDTGSSSSDNITSDTTPTFNGTAEANSTVTIISSVNGTLGTTSADGSGNWSYTPSSALSSGSHNITATARDSANNTSSASSALSITIDNSAPSAPSTPDLDASSDTGSSSSDNVTSDTTPTFSGTAEANSTVIVISSVNGTLGTTSADGSGNWSYTPSSALNSGSHNITATSTDSAGNTSTSSSALSISIDSTAPTVNSLTPTDNATDASTDGNLIITFNENMVKGTGNITIKKSSDNSTIETIPVGDAKITVSGITVTINPATVFTVNTGYYVQIDTTAFTNLVGINYAGISDAVTWNFTTANNETPTITGTVSNQAVNDNVSSPITPFSGITLADTENDNISVSLSLDDNAKGTLSSTSIASGSVASVQAALRAITFTPSENRVAPGSTETTTITIEVNDGFSTGSNNSTTIVSTSINDAPTNITSSSSSVNYDDGQNATVGTLSTTDVDTGSSFTYSLVASASSANGSCTSDANNDLFDISGSNLLVLDPSSMDGNYNVCVQSDDGTTTFQKSLTINVVGNNEPVIASLSISDQNKTAVDNNSNIIVYKNYGSRTITINATDDDLDPLTFGVSFSDDSIFTTKSLTGNNLELASDADTSGDSDITITVDDGVDTTTKTFNFKILTFNDGDNVNESGSVSITTNADGDEVTTIEVDADNLVVKKIVKNDGSTEQSISINGVESKVFSGSPSSVIEITEDGVRTTFTNNGIDAKADTTVLGKTTHELTKNGQTTKAVSNVLGSNTTISQDGDGNPQIVTIVGNIEVDAKPDGTAVHIVTNGSTSSKTTSSITGTNTLINNDNVQTLAGKLTSGTSTIKAKSVTKDDGTTVTRFVSVDGSGNETVLGDTLSSGSVFDNGNTVEIYEDNGAIYIKITTPLSNDIVVE